MQPAAIPIAMVVSLGAVFARVAANSVYRILDLFVRANWNGSGTQKRLCVSLLHAQLGWSRRAKAVLRAGACSSKRLVIAQRDAAPRRPSLPVAPDAGQS